MLKSWLEFKLIFLNCAASVTKKVKSEVEYTTLSAQSIFLADQVCEGGSLLFHIMSPGLLPIQAFKLAETNEKFKNESKKCILHVFHLFTHAELWCDNLGVGIIVLNNSSFTSASLVQEVCVMSLSGHGLDK